MPVTIPKTHYSLLNAFNLIGEEEYGDDWTGEEAAVDKGRCRWWPTPSAPATLHDDVAPRQYFGSRDKLVDLMALGTIPAEALNSDGRWVPFFPHNWASERIWFSLRTSRVGYIEAAGDGRKIRIDKRVFDTLLEEGGESQGVAPPDPQPPAPRATSAG